MRKHRRHQLQRSLHDDMSILGMKAQMHPLPSEHGSTLGLNSSHKRRSDCQNVIGKNIPVSGQRERSFGQDGRPRLAFPFLCQVSRAPLGPENSKLQFQTADFGIGGSLSLLCGSSFAYGFQHHSFGCAFVLAQDSGACHVFFYANGGNLYPVCKGRVIKKHRNCSIS